MASNSLASALGDMEQRNGFRLCDHDVVDDDGPHAQYTAL